FMAANLKIYTFGNFTIKNGEEINTRNKSKSSRRWKLLQYLITFSEQEISRDELIMILGLNNSDNPEGALSALVYRLRKYLARYSQKENEHFVQTTGSAYTFNNNADYWMDAEEFKNLCKETELLINNNSLKAVEVFEKALSLYNGDYLQEARTEEWLWSARNYYRDLLKNTLLKLDIFLQNKNEYNKLIKFYDKVQSLIKFDEEIIACLLKAMIKMGKTSEVQYKYKEIRDIYKDNNLILPPVLENIYTKMELENIEDPEVFLEKLDEKTEKEGAYFCTPEKFMELYELEKRRLKRDALPRCLIHFRLLEKKVKRQKKISIDHIDKIGEQFLQLLIDQIRSGDIVCRWHKKYFIVFLVNLDCEEAWKVSQRIENSFRARYGLPVDIKIEARIQKLF
ncbi:MAG: BTAD domain-containing putative transcriptional regulator, partial [Halanaerobiales bacterium]